MRIRCVSPDIGSRVESSQGSEARSRPRKSEFEITRANCSNQRVGRVSRTEERKMVYIRDATTGYIYRRGTIEHYIVAETKTNKTQVLRTKRQAEQHLGT